MSERVTAIARLVIIVILSINGLLTSMNVSPISNDDLYMIVSDAVTLLYSAWAWWKNNNITAAAAEAQSFLNEIKTEEVEEELSNGLEDGEVNE